MREAGEGSIGPVGGGGGGDEVEGPDVGDFEGFVG